MDKLKRFLDVFSFLLLLCLNFLEWERMRPSPISSLEDSMSMDIHSVLSTPNARELSSIEQKNHPSKGNAPVQQVQPDIQSAIQDLEQVSLAFNKKLQFSINKKQEITSRNLFCVT